MKLENEELKSSNDDPFDYYYKSFRGYLPSPQARWCTVNDETKAFREICEKRPNYFICWDYGEMRKEKVIFHENLIFNQFFHLEEIFGVMMYLQNSSIRKMKKQLLIIFKSFYNGKRYDRQLDILAEPIDFNRNNKTATEKALKQKIKSFS